MLKQTTWKLSLSILSSALVADLMAIILEFSLGLLANKLGNWILLLTAILNLFLLFLLIYAKPWEEGFRDPTRVKYKRMREFKAKGLVAGLFADLPFAVVFLLYAIAQTASWNANVFRVIFLFVNMPYNFFMQLAPFQNLPWLDIVFLIPVPLISGAAYLLGYKQISIGYRILYQKPKKR